MAAIAKLVVPAAARGPRPDDVLIHVRFAPNAEILAIDALPDHMTQRAWFERLYAGAVQHYQALAGGRGFFRIPRSTFDALQREAAQ